MKTIIKIALALYFFFNPTWWMFIGFILYLIPKAYMQRVRWWNNLTDGEKIAYEIHRHK